MRRFVRSVFSWLGCSWPAGAAWSATQAEQVQRSAQSLPDKRVHLFWPCLIQELLDLVLRHCNVVQPGFEPLHQDSEDQQQDRKQQHQEDGHSLFIIPEPGARRRDATLGPMGGGRQTDLGALSGACGTLVLCLNLSLLGCPTQSP